MKADILPVLVTNHTVTIAADLENGRTLVGQCEISHPSPSLSSPVATNPRSRFHIHQGDEESEASETDNEWAEDAMGEQAASTTHNVNYTKEEEQPQPLESPIRR